MYNNFYDVKNGLFSFLKEDQSIEFEIFIDKLLQFGAFNIESGFPYGFKAKKLYSEWETYYLGRHYHIELKLQELKSLAIQLGLHIIE